MYKPIEGDFIETSEGFIFDVKGLHHPKDRVIAFLRYYPEPTGNRKQRNTKHKYRKVYDLSARHQILKKIAPQYLFEDPVSGMELQAVLLEDIKHVYQPRKCLMHLTNQSSLSNLEKDAVTFSRKLAELSNVPLNMLGITGSILVGLALEDSDLDLIVYGIENGRQIVQALSSLDGDPQSRIQRYTKDSIQDLIDHRWRDLPNYREKLTEIELQKTLQGKYNHRDFFIRVIPSTKQIVGSYGAVHFQTISEIQLEGRIIDATNNFVTPCTYLLEISKHDSSQMLDPVIELLSYRGRFTEHVNAEDQVKVRGKLEKYSSKTKSGFRVILGNSTEDFLLPMDD